MSRWLVVGCASVFLPCAFGQTYPSKPIRIITAGIGGGNDAVSRMIATGVSGPLGQQIIVENRSATVSASTVAKAPADGYTLLVGTAGVWLSQFLQKMPYDAERDLAPVTLAATAPNVLVVHPSLPVSNVKALVALAKARPGELNYSTGATGSVTHLAGELFKSIAGVNIVRIPYKDSALESADQLSGQVHMSFGAAAQVKPHVDVKKLKALAVTSARESALFKLPTVAATMPGYEMGTPYGVWVPGGTPSAIVNRLHAEIVRYLKTNELRERMLNLGMEPGATTISEFESYIRADSARVGKLIRDAGIKAD